MYGNAKHTIIQPAFKNILSQTQSFTLTPKWLKKFEFKSFKSKCCTLFFKSHFSIYC